MIYSLDFTNIILEEFDYKDINSNYIKWLKNKETTKYLVNTQDNLKKSEVVKYFYSLQDNKNYFFKIMYNNVHVGNTRLGPLNFSEKKSGFGILIGDTRFRGKGIATQTILLLKDFLFNILNFEIIEFECVKDNVSAMNIYKKLGFNQKKTNKKFIKKNLSLDLTLFYMKKSER